MAELDWPEVQPVLGDDAVTLRPWTPEDAEWVRDACQDEEIQRWTRVPSPYLREHADGFVGRLAARQWRTRTGAQFVVADARTGDRACSIGLVRIDVPTRCAEAGYWTHPEHRGRGLTTRGLAHLTRWALSDGGLVRIELHVEDTNLASRRVAELAGFTDEGLMGQRVLHRGEYRDIALYARTRDGADAS